MIASTPTRSAEPAEPNAPAADEVARLRGRLAGSAIEPFDDGYEDARRVWNHMIDRRPALIVRCDGAGDVRAGLDFARRHGLAPTVRGGGHNIGGLAVADGGLMLDFSHRRGVRVDPEARTAEVEPGATLGDVDRATQEHGLALPSGIISETGISGLTLGGGFGWLSRRYGLTCDHLLSAEVVTVDGETSTVDEGSHPDLFWMLRGGGAPAVVTSFRFRLREAGPTITGGPMVHRAEHAGEAVGRFRERTADSPEELGSMLRLGNAPPAPFLPAELHGKPVVMTIACHSGGGEAAARDLEPLRRGTAPVADQIVARPFVQMQGLFDAGEPRGRRDYWKSEYVGALDDRLAAILLDAFGRLPAPAANIKVFHLGGAVSRVPAGATAAGHRDAGCIVVVASAWDRPEDDDANLAWVRDCWSQVHEHSGRGGYVNFLTEDADAEQVRGSYGGVDLDRLEAVRARYDREGLLSSRRVAARPSSEVRNTR